MVHLDGEGLFTVVHQNHTPFTVTAGSSTTRVLGTTFAVRHYATDTTTRIAVRDGKVAVDSTIISAAQQLTMSSSGGGRLQAADPTVFAFATGKLVLERMFLKAAVPELDRWYNADIRFADSTIGHSQIEGSFLGGSPADLREQLSWSLGFRVVRDGRVLTIYRK
jgi:ferric-dicitrate binding protein FerR (iron transport regulator)